MMSSWQHKGQDIENEVERILYNDPLASVHAHTNSSDDPHQNVSRFVQTFCHIHYLSLMCSFNMSQHQSTHRYTIGWQAHSHGFITCGDVSIVHQLEHMCCGEGQYCGILRKGTIIHASAALYTIHQKAHIMRQSPDGISKRRAYSRYQKSSDDPYESFVS